MKKTSIIIGITIFFQTLLFSQTSSVKVMYYNLLNFNGSDRIEHLTTVLNYAKPDILVVTEMASNTGCNAVLNILGSNYSRAVFTDGDDTDNMIFFKNKYILRSQDTIQTELRLINEYVLYYDTIYPNQDTTFFRFYAAHLKSSSGTTNEQQRLREVKRFTNHISGLSNPKNIFFGGDMNFYTHNEPAYQELITSINDPLGNTWSGDWTNNSNYAGIHTQSTRTRQFGGGAYGGMDDRFDFIFVSNDILSGTNSIHFSTYKAIGNDGQHFNDSINALPNNDVPDSVANALHYMSDHLPVMMTVNLSFPNKINEKGSKNEGFDFDVIQKPNENLLHLRFLKGNFANQNFEISITNILGKVIVDGRFSANGNLIKIPIKYKYSTPIVCLVKLKNMEQCYVKKIILNP